MGKIIFIFIFFLSIGYQNVMAQFDTQVSNYWAVSNYFNPGYAGQSGKLEVTGLYRLQWLGIKNAPRTGLVLGEMPFMFGGKEHGVGFAMYNDQIGLFKSNVISGQYAFKIKLAGGNLGIGIQGGYINESFDGTQVDIPDDDEYYNPTDAAIPLTQVSGKSVDGAAGIFYSRKKWYAGFSVTHVTAPKLELNENYILEIPRSYYFTAGYNIQLNNPLLEIQPTLLLKTMQMSSYSLNTDSLTEKIKGNTFKAMLRNSQVDISVRMIYDKKFWGGLSWKYGDAIVLMLGGKFKMIEAGYAYDFPISRIIKVSTGSHELFLRYNMDLNLKKKGKYKHKSVRIL